jgi:hypothetical protein
MVMTVFRVHDPLPSSGLPPDFYQQFIISAESVDAAENFVTQCHL